ncbi:MULTISPECIES: SDR family oxidoreductase [unclassified Rhodococcus (in: high G+C Gram-positive bacteria)]|uniref:SDR family oxidoreductase n=1 Tax=unclassified Rhodococcus (in: high G+C Gram-positive bacteria) TaxID=192944 RepID=UPI00146B21DC|nr:MULTISPECIES: SDR family oxidoreductase [unclassified Rhodococcus (in: high G+C Gram-positive bacteria)]MBF0661624.1 SDR family oxidoreductase [Rhodococcus sp. (in: high G+C Gram-positive bacteria)]NME79680.1 SDR family oxidoreductase [Rhodococcus sp. 105337]
MSRPERRNILITGASSGLGAGMAREFAARGRNLALAARRVDRLEALRTELLAEHPHITVTLRALDVDRHDDVFTVFREFDEELGGLDRVIVNAGLGKGQPLGTGYFRANAQTATTNFLGALAQSEAALELMRPRNAGHVALISSMSALRGMPRNMTTYAASKAAVASLGEGMRADLANTGIGVSTIYPGFIRSEINEKVKNVPFIVDTETGCRALAAAIEREPARAYVPAWPWVPLGFAMKVLPLSVVRRMV